MDSETWRFINTFAPWFSAVGTILAVVVSLYLARAEKPIKLRVQAGHRFIIEQGRKCKSPEYLHISAVNAGHSMTTIVNVGWKVGVLRKRHAIQIVPRNDYSSVVPVEIGDGKEAMWLIPLDVEDNWLESFSRDLLLPHPRWNLFWLRLQVCTSVGQSFEARVEKELRNKLLKACTAQASAPVAGQVNA